MVLKDVGRVVFWLSIEEVEGSGSSNRTWWGFQKVDFRVMRLGNSITGGGFIDKNETEETNPSPPPYLHQYQPIITRTIANYLKRRRNKKTSSCGLLAKQNIVINHLLSKFPSISSVYDQPY